MTAVGFLLLRAAVALGLAWVAGQCYVAGGPVYVLFALCFLLMAGWFAFRGGRWAL